MSQLTDPFPARKSGVKTRLFGLRASSVAYFLVALAASAAAARQSVDVRVSATIAPKLCALSDQCDNTPGNVKTKLVVNRGTIRYSGLRPVVTKKNGVMTILF